MSREGRFGVGLTFLGLSMAILFAVGGALHWQLGSRVIFVGLAGGILLGLVGLGLMGHSLFTRKAAAPTNQSLPSPDVIYDDRAPYVQGVGGVVRHYVGLKTPKGSPPIRAHVVLTAVCPPWPHTARAPVVPSAAEMLNGGNATLGQTLEPGKEELWFMATTAQDDHGVPLAGGFGRGPNGMHIGPTERLEERWRLTFSVVADGHDSCRFSFVLDPTPTGVHCEVQG